MLRPLIVHLQNGRRFFDITDHPELGQLRARSAGKDVRVFPEKPKSQKEVKPLLGELSKKEMEDHLTTFSAFHTRYYKVGSGRRIRHHHHTSR